MNVLDYNLYFFLLLTFSYLPSLPLWIAFTGLFTSNLHVSIKHLPFAHGLAVVFSSIISLEFLVIFHFVEF